MRHCVWFFCFVTFLPFVTPVSTITFFEVSAKILEIAKALLETFISVDEYADIIDNHSTKEKLILSSLDSITVEVEEISNTIRQIDDNVNIINRMLRNLPNAFRLELNLNSIHMNQIYLNIYYKEMERYIRDNEKYENSTLINFSNRVVSDMSNSVPFMMESIYQQVTAPNFLNLFLARLDVTINDYFCTERQSAHQVLHNFMNELLLLNMKSYILIHTAYTFKKLQKTGTFKKEVDDAYEAFQRRTNNFVSAMKPHMATAPLELWRCDPKSHKRDETYLEITNFLHGIVLNKVNLDPNGQCRDECDVFTYTTKYNCGDNKWCKKETTCPKIVNCQYVDSSMEVCRSENMFRTNRRYDYVHFRSGRHFGEKRSCSLRTTALETYRYWVVWKCSYCYCLCEEGSKFFSERYINMRLVESNIADNKVVIGLRFVKHHQIIHLQVQEGKVLPHGKIDLDTIRWVPVEDYSRTDSSYIDGRDYYTLTWEHRDLDLADIMAEEGSVVTGVAFRKLGTRLHLQVQTTPFNFTTGNLTARLTYLEDDPDMRFKHKFGSELKLDKVDVPTRSQYPSDKFTTNKYVKFANTGYEKDAGQTTIPFIDAQPVKSTIPVPLSGVGIFHKGRPGYGGFIAPKIFTYNFTKHLDVIFPVDANERLRVN